MENIGDKLPYNEKMEAIKEIEAQIKRKELKRNAERRKRKIKRARKNANKANTANKANRTNRANKANTANKANKYKCKHAGPVIFALIAGTVAIANASINYQEQNKPATIDQVLENGDSLENLKIDSNLLYRIEQIENKLQQSDKLENTQVIRIIKRYQ